jgi:hypothetical protein
MVILMEYIHYILYIVMDETTKVNSHMCNEPQHFVQENHVFLYSDMLIYLYVVCCDL